MKFLYLCFSCFYVFLYQDLYGSTTNSFLWTEVKTVESTPSSCQLIGKFEDESVRLLPITRTKKLINKVEKSIKIKAGKRGANVIHFIETNTTALSVHMVAKAYLCDNNLEDKPSEAKPMKDNIIENPPKQEQQVKSLLSEDYRARKSYFVAAGIGGAVVPVAGLGMRAGYFFDSETLLEATISSGIQEEDDLFWRSELEAKLFTVGGKKFLGNSLYLNASIGYRSMDYKFYKKNLENPDKPRYTAQTKALVIGTAIGNQWQFENFTIGTDWFGLTLPISNPNAEDHIEDQETVDRYADEINSQKKELTALSFQMLRFYCGLSF